MSSFNDPVDSPPPDFSSGEEQAGARTPEPKTPASGAVSAAEAELAALKATVASLEAKIVHQQAEFLNDMRRIQRQAEERVKFAAQPVVEDVLGVADALHGAIEGLRDSEHEQRVAEGLRNVERQLVDALSKHGIQRVDALGKTFDPALHQAVVEIESPSPARTVLQVVRPGFLLHGRLVRPAHVVVSKGKPGGSEEEPRSASGKSASGKSAPGKKDGAPAHGGADRDPAEGA